MKETKTEFYDEKYRPCKEQDASWRVTRIYVDGVLDESSECWGDLKMKCTPKKE